MVFSHHIFLFLFLPLVLGVYYLLRPLGKNARGLWLTSMTLFFYGWARVDFAMLLVISIVVDYWCGKIIFNARGRARPLALCFSIFVNIGLLLYFKYFNFVMDTRNEIASVFGAAPAIFERVILPAGISFYTFETMSYSIDIYRSEAQPARNILEMSGFVAFFPRLVAGPIVRYHDVAQQLVARDHTIEKFGRGALLCMCGFAKKILLADSSGRIAREVFDQTAPGTAAAWLGVLGYTMQIYYDFSGYSDMAIGLGRMFGFEFKINFASPYRSRSITEFWRRWHISLSTWLRDYLYVPLGGNRRGEARTYINLALTMLLGGLWHGAQWTFVAWGAYHGGLLAFERWRGKKAPWDFLPAPFQVLVTFVLVMIGWVFFRADSFTRAGAIFAGMAGAHGWSAGLDALLSIDPLFFALGAAGLVLVWAGVQSDRLVEQKRTFLLAVVALFLCAVFAIAIAQMFFQDYSPFLYFRF